MADKRISELQPIDAAGAQGSVDVLALADVSASETKKITLGDAVAAGLSGGVPDGSIPGSKIEENTITSKELAPNSVTGVELAPDSVGTTEIQDGSVTNAKLAGGITGDKLADGVIGSDQLGDNSVDGAVHIVDRSIPAIKLELNTITALEIAPNAIGQSELADDSVDETAIRSDSVGTDALKDQSVTHDKIALDAVDGTNLASDSVDNTHLKANAVQNVHLAAGIDGAKLLDGTVTDAKLSGSIDGARLTNGSVQNDALAAGIDGAKLTDGTVANSKLATGIDGGKLVTGSVSGTAIVDNSITAQQIAPNAVGASELADNSVDTNALADNAVSTPKIQDGSVTNVKLASGIDGAKLINNSVTVDKLDDGAVTNDKIEGISLDKLPDAASGHVLAGPITGPAASPEYRRLQPSDIPTATDAETGAVSVPTAGGLSVDGAGAVRIDNSVPPNGFPFINYNNRGLVTGGRALSGSDLPPPVLGDLGAVKAGDGVSIAPDGTISQTKTGVAPDTYTKVTVDDMGNVTQGAQLQSSDIPNINWDQINNPQIGPAELADNSVQMRHLADYSVSFIQETTPTVTSAVHVGTFWFKESTAALSQWNGNSWMSVGIGRLSAENLRYCGTFNATNGTITGLTQFGVAEGLAIGDNIPTASDDLTGVYFICQTPGNGTAVLPGVDMDAGDWCLCNGTNGGWVRIDTVSGGGGSGGATNLGDLLDVDIASATAGAFLQLQSDNTWKDVNMIDAGTY